MTNRETFKNNFKMLMEESKAKQIDIANYAEVSYQTVSTWATGRAYPRAEAMEKLCKFFGIKQSALTESGEETDEDNLLSMYRIMSDDGRLKLIERAEELVKLYPKRGMKNG